MKRIIVFWASTLFFWFLGSGLALSHVPYFEREDFTGNKPFQVKSIEQSIAVYAWLEFKNGLNDYTKDIDVYTFSITKPTRIFAQAIVPVCKAYENFLPSFALIGPGLPWTEFPLPFELPDGYGAIVVENYRPGEERPIFYEPFGNKNYYEGPQFDELIEIPGTYHVYYWDPYQLGGDYVAVLGYEETWKFEDIIRALIYTPMIRRDRELHIDCQ